MYPVLEPRLLAGPPVAAGAESLVDHLARLGPLPSPSDDVIPTVEASALLGRGGGAFPVGRKWRTVAELGAGDARLLVNGAEGEPLSAKDRTLMALRPHLVLDGALIAAAAVGAREVVVYVGSGHAAALRAMERAIAERVAHGTAAVGAAADGAAADGAAWHRATPRHAPSHGATRRHAPVPMRIVAAPDAYVAGEESAAVHYVNDGDARPTTTPPRPFERGLAGRPTLVQNVETLATVALIARYGDAWFRSVGRGNSRGSALISVGAAGRVAVREVELGTRVGEVAGAAGLAPGSVQAVLLGGYFGTWGSREDTWAVPLDPVATREAGLSFGAGVVSLLGHDACGVTTTARILDYMAGQSAAQCGPCVFGLRAIADAAAAVAAGAATDQHLALIARWSNQLVGRGACRHPDGVAGFVASALSTFAEDFDAHANRRPCQAFVARAAA
jgi:NADH:ubiquinone oxidoreductase subunit F (NADH-binding)